MILDKTFKTKTKMIYSVTEYVLLFRVTSETICSKHKRKITSMK